MMFLGWLGMTAAGTLVSFGIGYGISVLAGLTSDAVVNGAIAGIACVIAASPGGAIALWSDLR